MNYFLIYIALGALGAFLTSFVSLLNRDGKNTFSEMASNIAKRSHTPEAENYYKFIKVLALLFFGGQLFILSHIYYSLKKPFNLIYKIKRSKEIKRSYLSKHPLIPKEELQSYVTEVWSRRKAYRQIKMLRQLKELEEGKIGHLK